jgi:hypothetical protein
MSWATLDRLSSFPSAMEGKMIPLSCRLRANLLRLVVLVAGAAGMAGCGVVAAPVRATSAVVKVVPVAGDVVAAPLDVTADTID